MLKLSFPGFMYPLQALGVIGRSPQLWLSVLFPILVNLVIGTGLYTVLVIPGWEAITQSTAGIPDWVAQRVAELPLWAARLLTWLPVVATLFDDVLRWVLAIGLFIVTGLLLVQFGAVLGAPWYGSLAEQVEQLRMGQLPVAPQSLGRAARDTGRAIAFQLKKLLLLIAIGVPLLLLNLLPLPVIASSVAGIGGVALASLLTGLDFLDAPLERRRLSFRNKLAVFARTLPGSAAFSWVCLVLVSVPFLNLLAVPVCVVAGTLFCCDRVLPYLPEPEPK